MTSVTGLPSPAGDAFVAPEYKGKNQAVDVEGAKKVLTDAGFKLDGTTLTDPSGKPVKLTLTDPAGWSDYQTSLEIVKDNLSQIGIAATVDKANQDAWFKNVEEGKFDATFRWTNGGSTPYDIYQTVMDGTLLKPIGTGFPGRQLRPLRQPRGDRGAEGLPDGDRRRRPHHRAEHAAEGLRRAGADDPGRRGQRRLPRTARRTGSAGPTTRTRTAPDSPPRPTRWTSSCTSSPPLPDPLTPLSGTGPTPVPEGGDTAVPTP